MNDNPVYMCRDCLKNKQTKRKTFYTLNKPNPEDYKNQCLTCGGNNVVKINLTNDETERLINLQCNIGQILNMNTLKNKNYNRFIKEFERLENIQRKNDIKRQEWEAELKQRKKEQPISSPKPQYIPKCPTCGSPNIKKISATKRWVGVGLFGLASSDVGKTMQCEDCGYKW